MKKAVLVGIQAINLMCPECGDFCVNERGSSMIEEQDKTVTCNSCFKTFEVPQNAFTVKSRKERVTR